MYQVEISKVFSKLRWTALKTYLQSCVKSIENFVFRPKMVISRRAGMGEGGLPLPLAFQYLILMM